MKKINIVVERGKKGVDLKNLKLNIYCQTIMDHILNTSINTTNTKVENGDE